MVAAGLAVWSIVHATDQPRRASWDALAVIASALAGLIKESFIVLIPALIVLRLACAVHRSGGTWRKALLEAKGFVAGSVLVFAAELGVVAFMVLSKPAGFSATTSGMSLSSLSPSRLIRLLGAPGTAAVLALVAVWGIMWFDRRIRRDLLVAAAVILGLWLAPQVLLYSNGLHTRYLLPSIAGVAGAVALATAYLLRHPLLRVLGWFGVLAVLALITRGAQTTTTNVAGFTAETVSLHHAIESLAENVPSNQAILIVTDSGTGYGFEATYSVPMFLRRAGAQSPVYLWPIVSRGDRSPMHIAASRNNTAFKYPGSLTPQQVGGIIVLDRWMPSFDTQPLSDWLGSTRWREVVFSEPYYVLSVRTWGYRQIGEVTHRVLFSADSASSPSARPLVSVDARLPVWSRLALSSILRRGVSRKTMPGPGPSCGSDRVMRKAWVASCHRQLNSPLNSSSKSFPAPARRGRVEALSSRSRVTGRRMFNGQRSMEGSGTCLRRARQVMRKPGGELSSTVEQSVELIFEVVPCPSAQGTRRSIELENPKPRHATCSTGNVRWRAVAHACDARAWCELLSGPCARCLDCSRPAQWRHAAADGADPRHLGSRRKCEIKLGAADAIAVMYCLRRRLPER